MKASMYLVDAYSLIFQMFHAIPAMTSPKGEPTNAVFGFARDMLDLRARAKPEYLICAFDMPGPTFRDKLSPVYKANRPPMPADLQTQIPMIRAMLEAMRIPILGIEGYEADDIIATVATVAGQRGMQVYICTSDKDCRQLITDNVCLYNLRKQTSLDRQALWEDWGVTPEQVVDLQTLVGDSVDNVRGVPGIGIKTAAKLLQEFGTLDGLLANLDKLKGKKLESLRESLEYLENTRQLVRLERAVPIEADWEGWRLRDWDAPTLLGLFQGWSFRSFSEQVRRQATQDTGSVPVPIKQRDLFADPDAAGPADEPAASTQHLKDLKPDYHLVDDEAKFSGFLEKLKQQPRFAIDLETTGLNPHEAQLVGLAFSWLPGQGWYLAVRGPAGAAVLDENKTLAALKPILQDERIAKLNQNIKYDLLVLRAHGIQLAGVSGDPMVADYLLHAGERSHNLSDMALRYLQYQVIPITDLIGKKGKGQIRMDQVPTQSVAQYSAEDADIAWRLASLLEPQVAQTGMQALYRDVEIPLIDVLAELEFNGIRIDVPLLQKIGRDMAEQLTGIEDAIYKEAGRVFNIASPKQLREVLFDEMKLPPQRKTGVTGESSTDQETLERLAAMGHSLPRRIVDYRQISKLKGTYVDALPALVCARTGRIHASFNQTVAATGRLSSSDPNLQNIPVRTEQGRQIRQAFLPAQGWLMLTADYSQIELRLLAHFSEDAELLRAFAEDRDVHSMVAAQVFDVPEARVTSDQRRVAKTVNFGVIYGMSAHGLAQRLGIERDEAGRFIDSYFKRYPKVLDYQTKLLNQCRKTRYVGTLLGRRREISGIRSSTTYQQRNQPEREAINMEIQGSAADLIKLAMLRIHRRLAREKLQTRTLLQIHDELVFEAPPEEKELAAALVREEMTTPLEKELKLRVRLKVDQAIGPNWLDVEDLA